VLKDFVLVAVLVKHAAKFEFARLLCLVEVEGHLNRQLFCLRLSDFYTAEILLCRSLIFASPRGEDFRNLVTTGTPEA
jgi:hypothetical protein